MSNSISSQASSILLAIRESRGIYATIADSAGSQNFVNFALLNGLTYNDNPQGYDSKLLSGLGQTYTVSGSDSVNLKYRVSGGEVGNFTISSISAGRLSATASLNGKTLNSTTRESSFSLLVFAPSDSGEINLEVKASAAPTNGLFSILTNSNIPLKNCTVRVGGNPGLSVGAQVGIGVGVSVAVLGAVATAGYFFYKHMHPATPTGPAVGGMNPTAPTMMGMDPTAPSMGGNLSSPGMSSFHSTTPTMTGFDPSTPSISNYGLEKPMLQETVTAYGNIPPTQPASFVPPPIPPQLFKPSQPPSVQQNPTNDRGLNPTDTPVDHGAEPKDHYKGDLLEDPNQGQQPPPNDMPESERPRIPRIKRSGVDKHHHHEWTGMEHPCEDERCELNSREHRCYPDEERCPCFCRIEGCPVTKQREDGRMRRDALHTIASNAY
jgi:hypothetical protein